MMHDDSDRSDRSPLPEERPPDADVHDAVLDRLGHLICGLQGHDEIIQFDGTRMFLRCVNCGHETPGWDIGRRPSDRPDRRTAPFGAHADLPRAA
jgi:hypothetical protein